MAISEWDQRQLCPDGACVGVIGPDGTCKVCGRVAPDWGDERRRGLVPVEGEAGDGEGDATEGDGGGDGGGDEDEIAPSAPAVLGEMAEWQRRRLCPDGACVGVIGPDGTCKVCGKAASGEEAEEAEEDSDEDEDEDGDEEDGEDGEDEDGEDEDGEDEDGDEEDDEDEAAAAGDGDPDDRKLCPDGACIGVIGQDGRCKVCGKEAA